MNTQMKTLTFFVLSTAYIKKLGQFFFHVYYRTCLEKDISVLLKVINTVTSSYAKQKNNGLKFFKNTTCMRTIPLLKL